MTVWIIEPHEPVIVRDGRPFNHQPGVMAVTLPFPFPVTTAGAARSRAGSKDGAFNIAPLDLPALKALKVRGPLLVEAGTEGAWELLVPAPGDALLLEGEQPLHCQQLVPLLAFEGSQASPFRQDSTLSPVGLEVYEAEKPAKKPPVFWKWQKFVEWLTHPKQMCGPVNKAELGIPALAQEERVHVALERGMMVAREGALFETRGLEFTSYLDEAGDADKVSRLANARRLALWLDVEKHEEYEIQPGLDSLGGERRLVHWQKQKRDLNPNIPDCPICPEELYNQIETTGACRVILLTPAFFQNGYLPDASQWEGDDVKLTLCAAIVGRPQVVSGWDIYARCPKPTQRLAPAGSVFFLKLAGERDNIRSWIKRTWMKCLSEEQQNSNDGFGLAVLGSWNGEPKPMRLEKEDAQ
jgi:CRISPR-associated protein Cmr3